MSLFIKVTTVEHGETDMYVNVDLVRAIHPNNRESVTKATLEMVGCNYRTPVKESVEEILRLINSARMVVQSVAN